MTDRQARFGELRVRPDALEKEVARVERHCEDFSRRPRSECEPVLARLRRLRAGTRFEALKHTSQSAWGEEVAAFERASEELRMEIERAFQNTPERDA